MYDNRLKEGIVINDRYILKEYKGSGSFGEVWLAEDSELGIEVAIKLYISLDQKGQDEFKEEYKVAYGLSHENLLTAQYYSVWDQRPYLIMKYCSQGSASKMGGNATEKDIWKFIHDVANGLKYLHSQEPPIVHQDIKPENILIDEQGNYLLTDFGISKKLRSTMRKQSKRAIESGAIAYMGPERFLKDPMSVKASDIWSLGVSIYELATNDLPFMGQGGGMLNAGAALPELSGERSRNLNEVMQACLAKETWDRPTAEQLAEYTQLVLKGSNISYRDWLRPTRAASPSWKKWLILGGGICLIAIIIGCIFALRDNAPSQNKDDDFQATIEKKYAKLKFICENNINVGSPENYTSLITASELLDSLYYYHKEYSFIADSAKFSYTSLESALDEKINEAQAAWERSAEGQLNVAEDVSNAIMYYHIAYTLKRTSSITDALCGIAQKSGCKGAYMIITKAYLSDEGKGNNLVLDYIGINESVMDDVTILYEFADSDGASVLKGQATISIDPGQDQSVTIALNGDPAGYSNFKISNNNIVFYNSNTRK